MTRISVNVLVPDAGAGPDHDPYLLVLFADQEVGEGREDQAACLIEAAFPAFNRGGFDAASHAG